MIGDLIMLETLAEVKATKVSANTTMFILGVNAPSDGLGGFYRWDAASVDAEDTTYYNVVQKTGVATGRWVRLFVRTRQLTQGVLVYNGGVKTLYATGVTDANGRFAVNLTFDNSLSASQRIFKTILKNAGMVRKLGTQLNDAIGSQPYGTGNDPDLTTVTHQFYKGNGIQLVLGSLLTPFASVGAGVPVGVEIVGT